MTITQNSQSQSTMTPARALELLADGNRRFRAGSRESRNLLEQKDATAGGQWPYAVVLSCIDSRVSSELIFDTGLGDIFSARIAGNFVNDDLLGSLEFGCKVAGSKLIVVLGHSHCGAVKGACDGVELGHLTAMLQKIQPAVKAVAEPSQDSERNSKNPEFVARVARKNVDLAVDAIRERSQVLADLEADGQIQIVGGMYDIESGAVEFYDDSKN